MKLPPGASCICVICFHEIQFSGSPSGGVAGSSVPCRCNALEGGQYGFTLMRFSAHGIQPHGDQIPLDRQSFKRRARLQSRACLLSWRLLLTAILFAAADLFYFAVSDQLTLISVPNCSFDFAVVSLPHYGFPNRKYCLGRASGTPRFPGVFFSENARPSATV